MDQNNETGLKDWFKKLPEDVQEAISEDLPEEGSGYAEIAQKISVAEPHEYRQIITENPTSIENMGRVGRIRILSFICAKVYPFQSKVFHQILNDGDDEEGGRSKTEIMFLEDIKAFNEAVAKRAYKAAVSNDLEPVHEASLENIGAIKPG